MLKMLTVFGLAAILLGRPSMARNQQAPSRKEQEISKKESGNKPPAKSLGNSPNFAEERDGGTNQKKDSYPKNLAPWWKRPEWVIVDITAAYTVISLLALGAILGQVLVMKDTASRQLRAYVTVERGIIANVANPPAAMPGERIETVARILSPQAGPHLQITIKNTGQTPAYNLVHWAIAEIREYPLSTQLPTMPQPDHPYWNVLGPTVPEVKTLRMPRPLNVEEIDGLRNGTKAIYCQGEIRYMDAFKKSRWTRYRCMYATPSCGIIGVGTDLVYCEDGNEAN